MEAIMAAATPENAISLLKADHRKVADLFEQFEEKGSHKRRLAEQICLELTIHTKIEEEIFYPACDGIVDAASLKEAYVEHDGAKVLIAEIEAGSPASDDYYEAKVKVLSEMIKHHVNEEERWFTGVFSQAKRSDLDMDALGEKLAARKEDLLAEYKDKGLPRPDMSTFVDAKG
jgi:hypothetical protein